MPDLTRLTRWLLPACCALALGNAAAADVGDCLKLADKNGGAVFSNVCIDWLNVMYCIEGGQGPTACASKPKDVITLTTGDSVPVSGYDGRVGSVHWAVCPYPEAPVGWDPGPDRPYTCRKTCVMC